jgi:hypothetical protein
MRSIIIAMLTQVLVLGTTSPGMAMTSAQLLQSCESLLRDGKVAQDGMVSVPDEALMCWNYMQAIQNASKIADDSGRPFITNLCATEKHLDAIYQDFRGSRAQTSQRTTQQRCLVSPRRVESGIPVPIRVLCHRSGQQMALTLRPSNLGHGVYAEQADYGIYCGGSRSGVTASERVQSAASRPGVRWKTNWIARASLRQ